jgi:hypothetical protein
MRTNAKAGTIRLNGAETRAWRKTRGPSAKGKDLGAGWRMRDELTGMAVLMLDGTKANKVEVSLADGEVIMRFDRSPKKAVTAARRINR